jgi:ligand-binding SRPBCC domain-containing protein
VKIILPSKESFRSRARLEVDLTRARAAATRSWYTFPRARPGDRRPSACCMTSVVIRTKIEAPVQLCFDLARDVRAHEQSASFSRERVIPPGRTEGLLELGDLVAFEGRHFGVTQRFVARITELEAPHRFVDEMVSGAFRWLRHVHEFKDIDGVTEMVDTLTWEAPFGIIGRLADFLFLQRHMESFVRRKQNSLKSMAEAQVNQAAHLIRARDSASQS